jgi:hypothetical protein
MLHAVSVFTYFVASLASVLVGDDECEAGARGVRRSGRRAAQRGGGGGVTQAARAPCGAPL